VKKTKTTWVEQKEIGGGEPAKTEARDPVCGMLVNESESKYISNYHGEKYCFCGAGCKQAFDKQPETYLSSAVSDL
jgi:YHS domain-containing protein